MYYGTDGKPVICRNGYAGVTAEYDDRGNRIRYQLLGTDGKPSPLPSGILGKVTEYDASGNITHYEWLRAEETEK